MQSSSVQSSPLQIWKRLEGPRELPRGPRAAGGEAPPLPGGGGGALLIVRALWLPCRSQAN